MIITNGIAPLNNGLNDTILQISVTCTSITTALVAYCGMMIINDKMWCTLYNLSFSPQEDTVGVYNGEGFSLVCVIIDTNG